MRAETAKEALACALHVQLHPDCEPPFCCAFWSHDEVDAEDLERALAEIGWSVRPDVSLPDSLPAGEPRIAAAEIENLKDRSFAVWQLVSMQGTTGLTSVELNDLYASVQRSAPGLYPPMKHDSPRKRLPELERAGHLVKTDEIRDGAHVWVASGTEVSRLAEAS